MPMSLSELLVVYPHIRCSIFDGLKPSEVSRLCHALCFRLDVYDKETYLNPMDEVFDIDRGDPPLLTTVLMGDNVRLLPTMNKPPIDLHAYNTLEGDAESYDRGSAGYLERYILRNVGLTSLSRRLHIKTEDGQITMSITEYSENDDTYNAVLGIISLNDDALRDFTACHERNTSGVTYEYYTDCVVMRGSDWRFDKVHVQVNISNIDGTLVDTDGTLIDLNGDLVMIVVVTIPLLNAVMAVSESFILRTTD